MQTFFQESVLQGQSVFLCPSVDSQKVGARHLPGVPRFYPRVTRDWRPRMYSPGAGSSRSLPFCQAYVQ